MKLFLKKILLFPIPIILIFISIIYILNKKIEHGKYFSIKPNTEYIVLGHSHPEHALNDSFIDRFENFSESSESYFYTYKKIKKLIEENKQIKTVFIEFSNNSISMIMNEFTWEEPHISYRYIKYEPFFNISDYFLLFSKNPKSVLNAESLSLKKNFNFLTDGNENYIKYTGWGGYKPQIGSSGNQEKFFLKFPIAETSEINIKYLQLIINYCSDKKVKAILIRCPIHHKNKVLQNEATFNKIRSSVFSNIEFIDFKDFPLNDSDFYDLGHLNYNGAKKFSIYFNKMLNDGLLETKEKQKFVNQENLNSSLL